MLDLDFPAGGNEVSFDESLIILTYGSVKRIGPQTSGMLRSVTLIGVFACALSGIISFVAEGVGILKEGLESCLNVMPLVLRGGRSLKMVEPSAACQEKIVSAAANEGVELTTKAIVKLRLLEGLKRGMKPFLRPFTLF